jgi:hypothetical protein
MLDGRLRLVHVWHVIIVFLSWSLAGDQKRECLELKLTCCLPKDSLVRQRWWSCSDCKQGEQFETDGRRANREERLDVERDERNQANSIVGIAQTY